MRDEMWRKSVDLPKKTVILLQCKASFERMSLKRYLEELLSGAANEILEKSPDLAKMMNAELARSGKRDETKNAQRNAKRNKK